MLSNPIILVASDFSPSSDLALIAGERIRRETKGTLNVVHVAHHLPAWDWITTGTLDTYLPADYKEQMNKALNQRLEEQLLRCEAKGDYQVLHGTPAKILKDEVCRTKADLMIMGHRGGKEEDGLYLGSLAQKMIASLDIPLLVVNKGFEVQKIAGLVDAFDPMKCIFPATEEFGFVLSAEVQFLSVYQDISAQFVRRSPLLSTEHLNYTKEEKQKIEAQVEMAMREKMDPHSNASLSVLMTENKDITLALAKALEEKEIDLAVMARHQKGLLEKVLIGSVTRRMLDIFKGNLLILPPKQ